MEAVIFDGKEYIKAAVLAERFKYTQDYLGQLCRAKKVDARLVGRAWYINLDSLNNHKKTRYKGSEKESEVVTSSSHSSQNYLSRIDVEPVLKKKTVNIIKNEAGRLTEFQVKYEKDDYSLIPKISHEAVLKDVRVLPAEAEDVTVKTEKEASRITTFKAEALPEVYLKGTLKVDRLSEVTEESFQDTTIHKQEVSDTKPDIEVKPHLQVANQRKAEPTGAKKHIKIKLYRENVATKNTPTVITPKKSILPTIQPKRPEKEVPSNKIPRSLQTKQIPVRNIREEQKRVTKPSSAKDVTVIPHATFKAAVILVSCILIAFSVFLPKENFFVRGESVVTEWQLSLDLLQATVSFLVTK